METNEKSSLAHSSDVEPNDHSNTIATINYPNKSETKGYSNAPIAPSTVQEHRKTASFFCQVCGRQFSRTGLAYHMTVHDPEESFILECDQCGKKFSRKLNLLRHFGSHRKWKKLSIAKLTAPCPICKKVISRHNISTHILNMHKNTKRVRCVCEVCGKGFESQSLLADHAVVHIDRSLIEVQCNICGRWQKTQRSLKAHHKRHKRHTPQQCGHCDKILYSANEMKVHIAQFHEMRKHQCSICKKAFIRPIRLREHIASVHTGEKAYNCLSCTKSFKSNSNRFRHLQEQHPREYDLNREKKFEVEVHKHVFNI